MQSSLKRLTDLRLNCCVGGVSLQHDPSHRRLMPTIARHAWFGGGTDMDHPARPTVWAEVSFLPEAEGGRRRAPVLCREYRPHVVVQPPDVRHAVVDADGVCHENYLGVCFLDGPMAVRFGEPSQAIMDLMYHPDVDYVEVVPGATLTIREGGKVVGYGRVTLREDPPASRSGEA